MLSSFDQVNPGVIDPGDGFFVIAQLVNGSSVIANNVTTSNVASTSGQVAVPNPSEVVNFGSIPPGGSAQNSIQTAAIGVSSSAQVGTTFFIDFDVTSDGQTRRFRSVPITIGQSGNATPVMPATPLN